MRQLIACLLASITLTAWAEAPVVEHRVRFPDRLNQYVDVQLRIPAEAEALELAMPSWTPGSYLIRDYASQVERLRAAGTSGRQLGVTKVAKNRWRIDAAGESLITVDYTVWAGELAVNTNWVEAGYALLNGAGTFLFSNASRGLTQRLFVELPEVWTSVSVALPRDGAAFVARDYDELIDSPVLAGNATEYRFTVGDQEYALVNQGETAQWDGARAVQDASRVVAAVQQFWRVNPFDRPYLFLNLIAEGSGGLEHDHSTVLLSDTWQMRDRADYIEWLSLLTHEFFHAWNVRRLRPRELLQYDYDRENYTRELWLAEGLTSYYDNLLLFRSGAIAVDEYLALLASEVHRYETTPGRQVRSAEMASFDAWIKHYRPDANSINSGVSYYRKGSVIAFVTDVLLRRATEGVINLDILMREFYGLHGPNGTAGTGYPRGAFQSLIEERAGADVRARVESMLTTVADPDVDEALQWLGLQLDRAPTRTAAEASGLPAPADFGLLFRQDVDELLVEVVMQGGSGAAAGVLPADELLAIDSTRVTRANLPDRMQRLVPGETVELLLARHGRVFSLPVEVQHAIPDKYLITIRADISRQQKKRMTAWLGVELKFVSN